MEISQIKVKFVGTIGRIERGTRRIRSHREKRDDHFWATWQH